LSQDWRSGCNQAGLPRLPGFHVALRLIKLDALATRAIGHPLVEISAMLADPHRSNSAGQTMLAITNVSAFFVLFPHFLPALNNAPQRHVGCIDLRTASPFPLLLIVSARARRRGTVFPGVETRKRQDNCEALRWANVLLSRRDRLIVARHEVPVGV
jgi:hypothetical protein